MGGMFVVAHATTRKRTSTSAVDRCRECMASPIEWVHCNAMLAHEHSPQLDDSDCCCHVHRRITAIWPSYPSWPGLDASVERLVCGVKAKMWRALQLLSEARWQVSKESMLPSRDSQARQRSGTDHR